MDITKETWEFINSFAPWLSAIATIAAVIVALYLARLDKRIKLRVSAGHRLVIPADQFPENPPEYLVINVVNLGYRDALITNLHWKIGLLKKQLAVQTTINDGISSRIPTPLKEGEEANYYIPLNEGTNWLNNFINNFLQPYPKFRLKFTKIQVYTSVGRTFESKIEKSLSDRIKQKLNGS